jgi:hypothetical protein
MSSLADCTTSSNERVTLFNSVLTPVASAAGEAVAKVGPAVSALAANVKLDVSIAFAWTA